MPWRWPGRGARSAIWSAARSVSHLYRSDHPHPLRHKPDRISDRIPTESPTESYRLQSSHLPSSHPLAGVGEWLRVAGAVGEEDAVGPVFEHFASARSARQHRHLAADLHQAAEDVQLHAEIESDDVVGRWTGRQVGDERAGETFVPF